MLEWKLWNTRGVVYSNFNTHKKKKKKSIPKLKSKMSCWN